MHLVETGCEQSMMAVFSTGERAVTGAALLRFTAFLRQEVDLLPAGHPMRARYQGQLAALEPLAGPISL